MHLTLAGGRLWRKLMSICEHKRAPVEHIILFFPSGDLVSEVWVDMSVEKRFTRCVDPCQRCLTLDHTRDLCVMCLGEEHARSVLEGMECVHCEHFFWGKSSALGHLPPAARVQPLLRQWRDWVRGVRRLTRVNCGGRCIVCYIVWSSRKCFAGSWCADEGGADISEPSQLVCPAI